MLQTAKYALKVSKCEYSGEEIVKCNGFFRMTFAIGGQAIDSDCVSGCSSSRTGTQRSCNNVSTCTRSSAACWSMSTNMSARDSVSNSADDPVIRTKMNFLSTCEITPARRKASLESLVEIEPASLNAFSISIWEQHI